MSPYIYWVIHLIFLFFLSSFLPLHPQEKITTYLEDKLESTTSLKHNLFQEPPSRNLVPSQRLSSTTSFKQPHSFITSFKNHLLQETSLEHRLIIHNLLHAKPFSSNSFFKERLSSTTSLKQHLQETSFKQNLLQAQPSSRTTSFKTPSFKHHLLQASPSSRNRLRAQSPSITTSFKHNVLHAQPSRTTSFNHHLLQEPSFELTLLQRRTAHDGSS